MQTVLTPSRSIKTPELLKGRSEQLKEIRQSLFSVGRQVFVHGYRGVGKTSLAQTAAFQYQSSDNRPILISCSRNATFLSIMHDVVAQGIPQDPMVHKVALQAKAGVRLPIISGEIIRSTEQGHIPQPQTINECVRLTEYLAKMHSKSPVVVIDEFDLLQDSDEQGKFAEYVKQIGDQDIPLKLIFCGIGESIDELFRAHSSTYRYFHTVKLDRLAWEYRLEIINNAAAHLGIAIDDHTSLRIAKISDGFPHYIHLICEKLFWNVYHSRPNYHVVADLFEVAIRQAADAIAPELKRPYEKATRKYTNEYEEILWAVADNHQLQRPSSEIYESYNRIMRDRNKVALDRKKFNQRMNSLKKESHGAILVATRQGWYEFAEKIVRGYARLRAEQANVKLEIEHPLQRPRLQSMH